MKSRMNPVPEVECLKYHSTPEKPDIKIFVSHRIDLNCETLDDPIFIPVRCGAIYDEHRHSELLGDDTGDNISEKRLSYCELTVQYWAWKNIEADYYGLCHYRRYFNFSGNEYPTDTYGNVLDQFLTENTIARYGLDADSVQEAIRRYDVILPVAQDVSQYPEHYSSLRDQFVSARFLKQKDLRLVEDIIARMYPDYMESVQTYLDGTKGYFCNLFIMSRPVFFRYAEWLYSILGEFEQTVDLSKYDEEALRTIGHLAERLLGIFIMKNRDELKIKELQPVAFLREQRFAEMIQPEKYTSLLNVHPTFTKNSVHVILSCSDMYVPYTAAAIRSIYDTASLKRNYDILLVSKNISAENQRKLLSMELSSNVSLRIVELGNYRLFPDLHTGVYFSIETYIRLLLPYLFPEYEKILWLDSDTICCTDIAELYDMDIRDNLVGATRDCNATALVNGMDPDYGLFCREILGMEDPYLYFQAGVLIMNLSEFRNVISPREMYDLIIEREYPFCDQDILNKICYGKVHWIDNRWDIVADVDGYLSRTLYYWAPHDISTSFQKNKKTPKIIHYAGPTKPWHSPRYEWADLFWCACRKTPFYEVTLVQMMEDVRKGILRYGMDAEAVASEAEPPAPEEDGTPLIENDFEAVASEEDTPTVFVQKIVATEAEERDPNVLRRAAQCLKENGLAYTVSRVFNTLNRSTTQMDSNGAFLLSSNGLIPISLDTTPKNLSYSGTPGHADIKIFVSNRIDLNSIQIDNPLFYPVRCGAIFDDRDSPLCGDDTGENISDRRMTLPI